MATALLISVVDDDEASREAVSGLIRSMGHHVAAFACATDFLAWDGFQKTDFLIADLRMPGMTGLDLHRHLATAGAVIPTAIVTAYPTKAYREQAMKAGVMFFLTKPLSPKDLAACFKSSSID